MFFKSVVSVALPYILYATNLCGQVQPQFIQDPGQYGKALEANTNLEINGSPYFLSEWSSGVVAMANKSLVRIPKMRYDVLNEQIVYESGGKVYSLDPGLSTQFILIKGTDSLEFINNISGIRLLSPKAYANVSYRGKNLWLVKPVKSLINDPDAPYGSTKKKLIQSDQLFFLIKENKEVISFKMNMRSISKTFKLSNDQLSKFLNDHSYSFDNPDHYTKIFSWLDKQIL